MENHRRSRSLIPVGRIRFAAPQSVNVTTPARYHHTHKKDDRTVKLSTLEIDHPSLRLHEHFDGRVPRQANQGGRDRILECRLPDCTAQKRWRDRSLALVEIVGPTELLLAKE